MNKLQPFKISFGDIPNSSSSIDLVPSLTTLAPFCAVVLPIWTMLLHVITVIKTITWLLLSKLQGNKPHRNSPEPEPCLRNLHQHVPELSRTFQDLPEPTFRNLPEPTTSVTYTSIHRNPPKSSWTFWELASGTFRDMFAEPTPAYAGTLRNLPETASGTYTSTRRNSPEPSGTFLQNLLLRPAPAHTGAYLGWRPH